MKRIIIYLLNITIIFLSGKMAMAAPMLYTYDFTASGFTDFLSYKMPPNTSISGTAQIILDPKNYLVTGPVNSINLTIGNHTYFPSEVSYNRRLDGYITIGGNLNLIGRAFAGTDDFFLCGYIAGYASPGAYVNNRFDYTVDDLSKSAFASGNMTITESIGSIPLATPLPGTMVMFGTGLLGLAIHCKRRILNKS
jgi:hypothetical protein